jgi:hypothetical protein
VAELQGLEAHVDVAAIVLVGRVTCAVTRSWVPTDVLEPVVGGPHLTVCEPRTRCRSAIRAPRPRKLLEPTRG